MAYKDICEMSAQLDSSILWLAKRGIRVPKSGRYVDYQKTLNHACRARIAGIKNRNVAPPPDTYRLFTAMCEASDLWQISQLPEDEISKHRAFVQRIVSGQFSYSETSTNNQSRDCQFQLMTASFFNRAGSIVTLDNPADVMSVVDRWQVAVECKRPITIPALRKRIEEAVKQFRNHEHIGLNAIRMIGVDLTVLINPNFDVLIASSDLHAGQQIDEHIQRLHIKAKKEFERAYRNTKDKVRIDCILYRVQCVVAQPGGGNERIGNFWRALKLTNPLRQSNQALDEVIRCLPGFEV